MHQKHTRAFLRSPKTWALFIAALCLICAAYYLQQKRVQRRKADAGAKHSDSDQTAVKATRKPSRPAAARPREQVPPSADDPSPIPAAPDISKQAVSAWMPVAPPDAMRAVGQTPAPPPVHPPGGLPSVFIRHLAQYEAYTKAKNPGFFSGRGLGPVGVNFHGGVEGMGARSPGFYGRGQLGVLDLVDRYNREVASCQKLSAERAMIEREYEAIVKQRGGILAGPQDFVDRIGRLRFQMSEKRDQINIAENRLDMAHRHVSEALRLWAVMFARDLSDPPPPELRFTGDAESLKSFYFSEPTKGSYISLQNAPPALAYVLADRLKDLAAATAKSAEEADAKTVQMLKTRVQAGSVYAQYELALRHLEGKGVPRDDSEALRLLRLSAAGGNSKAVKKLSEMGEAAK